MQFFIIAEAGVYFENEESYSSCLYNICSCSMSGVRAFAVVAAVVALARARSQAAIFSAWPRAWLPRWRSQCSGFICVMEQLLHRNSLRAPVAQFFKVSRSGIQSAVRSGLAPGRNMQKMCISNFRLREREREREREGSEREKVFYLFQTTNLWQGDLCRKIHPLHTLPNL